MSVLFTKLLDPVVPYGIDQFVHEPFGGNEMNLVIHELLKDTMTDGVDQVRLTEANPTIDEQWVVRLARLLADGLGVRPSF